MHKDFALYASKMHQRLIRKQPDTIFQPDKNPCLITHVCVYRFQASMNMDTSETGV